MESEINDIMNVWLSIISSLCYCYFIPSNIPKGKYRLFSLLPIFYLFTVLPLSLSSVIITTIVTLFITWLANFKLLLFSFDQGPLSWDPPKSLFLFIAIASLPIKIRNNKPHSSGNLPLNLAKEVFFFAILMSVVCKYRESIHPKIILVAYCFLLFLLIDIMIASCNRVVRIMVGVELEPPSDKPHLSTSLQNFWGRRWNLMVSNILRHTVYKPVRSASALLLGDEWARRAAVVATFLVSGLMHELMLYNGTRATPTWEMTMFFVLHGVCVAAEMGVKRALTDRWRLPWFVSVLLTVGFVVATSFWLFFSPFVRNGLEASIVEEYRLFEEFMMSKLKLMAQYS